MPSLTRTVRFAVNPAQVREGPWLNGPNGYAGSPSMRGLGRHYELSVTCAGRVDPLTGYLINIKDIDRAVHRAALPVITRACDQRPETPPEALLPELITALEPELPGILRSVRWWLSPYYCLEMLASDHGTALLRQKFDFAASHRLHVGSLSESQNRELFGKCNNPGGHGHNYQFEPCIALRLGPGARPFGLDQLERICERVIIEPFDHKNLNCDTREFGPGSGVNPSVEEIARIFFERLAPAIRAECPDAELRSITVWETDRTSSTYPGG
jgi:6-pyruvoyltetrahydropterin/6-carboxytetrahydropterin synthase